MATKAIVCPECNAPAAPGRYACAQCGALLASVAVTPRSWSGPAREVAAAEVARAEPAKAPLADEPLGEAFTRDRPRRTPIAPAWTRSLVAEPIEAAPGPDEHWDDEPLVNGTTRAAAKAGGNGVAPGSHAYEADAPVTVNESIEALVGSAKPERKAAPIADKTATVPKPRRRSAADPEALARIAPPAEPQPVAPAVAAGAPATVGVPAPAVAPRPIARPAPIAPAPARAATAPAGAAAQTAARALPATAKPRREPALTPPAVLGPPLTPPAVLGPALAPPSVLGPAPSPAPAPRSEPKPEPRRHPAPRRDAVPAWPPPGDRGPLAELPGRVPAGVYLPPSAVLPSGEDLPLPGSTNVQSGHGAVAPAAISSDQTSERVSAADRLARLEMPPDTPRRVVAIGAVIASLGFLLPWTASPGANDLLGDYWIRWGLAGPGSWILVAALVGLAGLTLAGGRLATAPVGLPGVALAMLVLGLSWSYLFGYPERGVGIWVVIFGVFLLAVGGLLDMRAGRHRDPQPTV